MDEIKQCPECKAKIPLVASVCQCCGERLEGRLCPDCRTYCKTDARKCRWCGHFFSEALQLGQFRPFSVRASRVGWIIFAATPFPQNVQFTKECILITTYGFLGLYSQDEEYPWDKVVGFTYKGGLFWDSITVDTRGQAPARIRRLTKRDGQVVRRLLQSLER